MVTAVARKQVEKKTNFGHILKRWYSIKEMEVSSMRNFDFKIRGNCFIQK